VSGGVLMAYLLLVLVTGGWLLLLLLSLLSGAPKGRSSIRWRDRLLMLASVFLIVLLVLGSKG